MFQAPGLYITFLYYFACTNLIVLLVTTGGMGMDWHSATPYQLGILCGLFAGILGSWFNRSVKLSTSFKNKTKFTRNLQKKLSELGFTQVTKMEEYTLYEKPDLKNLFAGKVMVKIDDNDNSATIISRSKNLPKLKELIES
ncbi:MAG: hypothetical protein D6756_00165 [Cyanobacteria bacterium J083]|nr:MAG: hypothetical protein D6756_00165 [Cyanobacteria bacterium J083]